MKLVQVTEENKRYYTKDFIHGFNTGAKTQYEADKKETERHGRWLFTREKTGLPKWTCSVCGGDGRGDYLRCPWCAAKMGKMGDNR